MTIEDRRLHDACGNHQAVILQNFARFIDDTTFFAHATFAIRQNRQHVESQLAPKEIVFINRNTVQQLRALPRQRIDRFFPLRRGRQQVGNGNTRQAAIIDQRLQRRQQLAGQAVWYRDHVTVAVVAEHERVDVRHHQRHVRLQRKQAAKIDNQTTGVGGFFDIRRAGFDARGEESQLGLGPVKVGGVLHDDRFATITQMFARAFIARQRINFAYRKLAFSKGFKQGFAYGAGCAQYGNIPAFRHGGVLQKIATLPDYPTGALRRY